MNSVRRPACTFRPEISWTVSMPPLKAPGSRRVLLYCTTGRTGSRVPTCRVDLEMRILAVRPSSLYSSAGSPLAPTGSMLPMVLPLLESSLTPSRPMASAPKPTKPSV
ncbi:hypothetical protein D3C78_1380730 [compost metagenome]